MDATQIAHLFFLENGSYAWDPKIYYLRLRYRVHKSFFEEYDGKDKDQT
jgi:hypothetical protein